LITSNPSGVLRIFNDHLLLVRVFNLNLLSGCLLSSFNEIQDTCSAKSRDDESLPDQGVLAGEELCWGSPEGGGQCRRG
jgi:hypothetical protein